MRVTNKGMVNLQISNIQKNLEKLQAGQYAISTGKKISQLSDDPITATRILNIREGLRDLKQYNENIEDSTLWLNLNETVFTQAKGLVTNARNGALKASNGTIDAATRQALSNEIAGLRDQMLDLANTRYKGRYIFSGYATDTRAFSADGTFRGDASTLPRVIGPGGLNVGINFSGSEVFQGRVDVFAVLQDLADGLSGNDITKINAQIDLLTQAEDQLITVRAETGSRINRVEMATAQNSDAEQFMTEYLSSEEDVDIVKATLELKNAQSTYEATLAVSANILQRSLMDFLK